MGNRILAILLVTGAVAACGEDTLIPDALPPSPLTEEAVVHPLPSVISSRHVVLLDDAIDPVGFAAAITQDHGGTVFHVYQHILKGFAIANLPKAALNALNADSRVRRVAIDKELELDKLQIQSVGSAYWSLDRVDQRYRPLDNQYRYAFTGRHAHIYILDSGIYRGHQEFGGRIGEGYSALFWHKDPYVDNNGHGTAVAGIAAGAKGGVAKHAILHSVKIVNGSIIYVSNMLEGLDWVGGNAVEPAVVNVSAETSAWEIRDAFDRLWDQGILVTTSAGNKSEDACLQDGNKSRAIVVSSTDANDVRSDSANWGTCVDLFAPGEDITVAGIDYSSDYDKHWTGTSLAAPMAAGVAAQVYQQTSHTPSVAVALKYSATEGVVLDVVGSPNRLLYSLHSWPVTYGPEEDDGNLYIYKLYNGDIAEDGTATWIADPVGGDGTWDSFVWEVAYSRSDVENGNWDVVSTSSTYSRWFDVYDDYTFYLRLSAASFNENIVGHVRTVDAEPANCTEWGCY